MGKYILIIFIFLMAGLLMPLTGQTQSLPPSQGLSESVSDSVSKILPGPFQDLFKSLSKISLNKNITLPAVDNGINSQSITSGITNLWNRANDWLESNIGISLKQIVKAIGNVFVWILELLIKLVKIGLSTL